MAGTKRQYELQALTNEIAQHENMSVQEAQAEAEDQLSKLMAYARHWDADSIQRCYRTIRALLQTSATVKQCQHCLNVVQHVLRTNVLSHDQRVQWDVLQSDLQTTITRRTQ